MMVKGWLLLMWIGRRGKGRESMLFLFLRCSLSISLSPCGVSFGFAKDGISGCGLIRSAHHPRETQRLIFASLFSFVAMA